MFVASLPCFDDNEFFKHDNEIPAKCVFKHDTLLEREGTPLNYGRAQIHRAFESHYENLMQSSLTQTKLTLRVFPASRHSPGYLQPAPKPSRCSYSMILWRRVAPTAAPQDSEDRLCAGCEIRTRGARKRVPARQPSEQEPQP